MTAVRFLFLLGFLLLWLVSSFSVIERASKVQTDIQHLQKAVQHQEMLDQIER